MKFHLVLIILLIVGDVWAQSSTTTDSSRDVTPNSTTIKTVEIDSRQQIKSPTNEELAELIRKLNENETKRLENLDVRKSDGTKITGAPDVTTERPTTEAPIVITEALKVTTQAPVVTTEAPKVTTQAPVVTTEVPKVTTQAPVVTTEAPKVTTQAPVVTTEAPKVTTQAPVVTTEEVTTQAPVVTTQVPKVTTQAPVVTTEVPKVTTQARVVTTEVPKVTTQAPVVTTQPPKLTTQAPVVTTEAPKVTTQAPKKTTTTGKPQNLEIKKPVVTTKAPEVTTTTQIPEVITLGPEVRLETGRLRPAVLKSRSGRDYYAFKGIPFAEPPITALRFKDPAPASPWNGVLNATRFAPPCVQYNILTDTIEGDENCLHLNVFTPKLPKVREENRKFPVIVFIHQGAFMFGASKDYEAKYLMDEEVVLVTIAYRLGAFGFLNTEGGNSDVYGNMGLKDQVLALKWIQDNIANFNGQKDLVTIMGESAGGASVHYHLLSDRSKGLFSRAISMSGTALSPWAFTRSPRKNAKKLGTMLNCPTTIMYELYACLHSIPAHKIAQKQKEFYEWGTDPISPFGPSVEVDSDEESVFLKDTPYSLISQGKINDQAPWMLGVVEDVCLLDAWSILADPQLVADMNIEWHRIAPIAFSFRDTALEPDAVSNQIRAFYFESQGKIGNETAHNLTNLYSDRWFNHGTRTAAAIHGKMNEAVPLFLYVFSYQGEQSHLKFLGFEKKLGVSEGDELQYFFNMNRFNEIPKGSKDEEFSKKVIKLLVSFALEGKPSGTWTAEQKWNQMSLEENQGNAALMFYKIDQNCSTVEEPFGSRMSFWDNLPLNEMENELDNPYARKDVDYIQQSEQKQED